MKPKITVTVAGYNEETRAEAFYKSICMFDDWQPLITI